MYLKIFLDPSPEKAKVSTQDPPSETDSLLGPPDPPNPLDPLDPRDSTNLVDPLDLIDN